LNFPDSLAKLLSRVSDNFRLSLIFWYYELKSSSPLKSILVVSINLPFLFNEKKGIFGRSLLICFEFCVNRVGFSLKKTAS
jgi:hypothetical protein